MPTDPINPDRQRHVFRTFMGLPPDANDPPVCGATLTSAYDGRNVSDCPACLVILKRWQREQAAKAVAR